MSQSVTSDTAISRRDLLVVYLAMLCAVAVLVNRETLVPIWARPEAYRLSRAGIQQLRKWERIGLRGRPDLLVSDSQGMGCNWDVDGIVGIGASPQKLVELFQLHVAGPGRPRYEQIVLFVGTAYMAGGAAPEDYVEAMSTLVTLAQEQGDRVIVVSPFPYNRIGYSGSLAGETITTTKAAVRQLRARFPALPVYDMNDLVAVLEAEGPNVGLQSDGIHLNGRGYRLLAQELAPLGFQVRYPQ